MNELRQKIRQQYLRGAQYGELRSNRGNDPNYVPDPIEYESKAIDAILDAVIAALPKERHELVRRDNGYQPDYEAIGSNNTLAYIKSILQAAKENK